MKPAFDLVSRPPSAAAARGWRAWGRPTPRRLNLALQGGGAHGAFTWGVLEALLDEPGLDIEGISGSSAGALNAVVLANGRMAGGADGARAALQAFWTAIASHRPPGLVPWGSGDDTTLAPASRMLMSWATRFAPAQFNPLDLNPLRDVLREQIDFDGLRRHSPHRLFVAATQARTGRLRVFREHELDVDVLLASTCLPRLHHSVEIDGEPYWDGAYAANPAVYPLLLGCDVSDVLLVLLGPLEHEGTPRTKDEIEARIAELTFGANFRREMHGFACAQRAPVPVIGALGWRSPLQRRLQRARFHMIDTDPVAGLRRTDTKVLAYGPFLDWLRDQGHERGRAWCAVHGEAVGRRSSIDVQALFG